MNNSSTKNDNGKIAQQTKPIGNLFALLPFFKPYRREVFFALLSLLITALMVLCFGKAIKFFIDFGFVEKNHHNLAIALLAFIAAVLIMAIAGYFRSFLINEVAEKVIADLRKKTYQHIIRVSAEFFEITKSGDIVSRLTADTIVLQNVISNTISFFLRNSLLFLGGICFIFLTSVKLSLLSLILIVLAISPIFVIGRKIKIMSMNSQKSLASIGSRINESIEGIKTIQSYCCEEKEISNFSTTVDEALRISLAKIRVKSLMIAAVITLAFGSIAAVLWVGGSDVINEKMTSGELSSFIFYSIITATSLVSLSQIAGQLQSASSAAARIIALQNIESPVQEAASTLDFADSKDINIKFHNVEFSYPSRLESAVLQNFDLEIKPREKLAIVGSSGSGKSTIFQLLLRFYDANSGMITLNGFDVKALSLAALRRNFSYISQDCFIFSGTIFENITYAKQVSEAELEKLVTTIPALDFINHLPQKMHTLVGEKGVKLSGGERQRIALARAIIKDSPIFLLDEATSALDNRNEQSVMRSIADLAKNKTVITVSHKLSSVINADRIVFLHEGKIAEIGSHQELMAQNGFYKKMYEAEENQF
jgi:ATP-binding cassette subfamily B protein